MAFQKDDGEILAGAIGNTMNAVFGGPISWVAAFVGLVMKSLTAQAKRNKEYAQGYYQMEADVLNLFASNQAEEQALEAQYLTQAQAQIAQEEQARTLRLIGIVIVVVIVTVILSILLTRK